MSPLRVEFDGIPMGEIGEGSLDIANPNDHYPLSCQVTYYFGDELHRPQIHEFDRDEIHNLDLPNLGDTHKQLVYLAFKGSPFASVIFVPYEITITRT